MKSCIELRFADPQSHLVLRLVKVSLNVHNVDPEHKRIEMKRTCYMYLRIVKR